uniref:Uncharacterized protein n=2 Tax=Meloidogyne TaxID=189290 RepID=A0A6V7UE83_MELEN|nr:unnamed protein product [Meloidogyne enterolobii]
MSSDSHLIQGPSCSKDKNCKLEKDKERKKLKRKNETQQEKANRLSRDRENKKLKRAIEADTERSRSYSITTLPVHLSGEHVFYFDANMTDEEIREKIEKDSELLAYFELNKKSALARDLYYHEIPEKFVFKKGIWTERKTHFYTIGRMVKVSPAETERYHLRLLLLNVKGATSFDDLRTVSILTNLKLTIRKHATFADACLA